MTLLLRKLMRQEGRHRAIGSAWTSRRSVILAWILWAVFLLIIAGLVVSGNRVTQAYRQAAANWFLGQPLYTQTDHGFIYLPHASILFAPFAALPLTPGEVLWRLLIVSTFALGVRRLATLGGRESELDLFPMMTCLCIPLAAAAALNGQSTLPVTALMILAIVDMTDGRWWRATLWLTLGLAVKPLIAFLLLLAVVLNRQLRWRLPIALTVLFLVPFLFQRPDYVTDQYVEWTKMLARGTGVGIEGRWCQLFGMLSTVGIDMSAGAQNVIRVAAALLTLVLCAIARQRHTPAQAGVFLFVFNVCYLMLFNPRTENNTYSALAPAIAVLCAQAWLVERRRLAAVGLVAIAVAVVGNFEIGTRVAPGVRPVWLAPLSCVCFMAYAITRLVTPGRRPDLAATVDVADTEVRPFS